MLLLSIKIGQRLIKNKLFGQLEQVWYLNNIEVIIVFKEHLRKSKNQLPQL